VTGEVSLSGRIWTVADVVTKATGVGAGVDRFLYPQANRDDGGLLCWRPTRLSNTTPSNSCP
jgi:hypothetical protein